MSTQELLNTLLLGSFLGIIGQGIRTIVGMKKLNDEAEQAKRTVSAMFERPRFFLSIFIGLVAGSLATLPILEKVKDVWTYEMISMIIASGYAGTDFIEGFVRKYYPNDSSNQQIVAPQATVEAKTNS